MGGGGRGRNDVDFQYSVVDCFIYATCECLLPWQRLPAIWHWARQSFHAVYLLERNSHWTHVYPAFSIKLFEVEQYFHIYYKPPHVFGMYWPLYMIAHVQSIYAYTTVQTIIISWQLYIWTCPLFPQALKHDSRLSTHVISSNHRWRVLHFDVTPVTSLTSRLQRKLS